MPLPCKTLMKTSRSLRFPSVFVFRFTMCLRGIVGTCKNTWIIGSTKCNFFHQTWRNDCVLCPCRSLLNDFQMCIAKFFCVESLLSKL